MRDRLVCGLRDGMIQKKLLSVVDLTFKRASEITLAMDIADKNTQDFRPNAFSEVKNISRETTQKAKSKFNNQNQIENPKQGFTCFRGEGSHAPNLCKFKDEKCYLI